MATDQTKASGIQIPSLTAKFYKQGAPCDYND